MSIDTVPLIRASQVRPLLAVIDHIGAPRERLLRESKLPLFAYDDAEAVFPELFLWGLADKVVRSEGIEDLGLFAVTHTPVWQSEPEFTARLQSSPTLWIALSTFCRMTSQFSTAVPFEVVRKGDQTLLQCGQHPSTPGKDQAELYDLQIMIQIIQLAAGRDWTPPKVYVSEVNIPRLARRKEFERVRIRPSNSVSCVVFPSDMLAWPMQAQAHPPPCELQLPAPLNAAFLDSLSALIGTYLRYHTMNIQLAAEMAGLSIRTFQRRLRDLQLDYSTLIDHVRLQRALSFLRDPSVLLTDIAYDLGYSDAAHFTRAFQRWTALSPREYRRQTQAG
ncbi:HTH-type transcriptional regulator VirS [Halioglobus japonicus]|nr:HTH-type transcriptional regulator VirS [Halioglobus japonicus]